MILGLVPLEITLEAESLAALGIAADVARLDDNKLVTVIFHARRSRCTTTITRSRRLSAVFLGLVSEKIALEAKSLAAVRVSADVAQLSDDKLETAVIHVGFSCGSCCSCMGWSAITSTSGSCLHMKTVQ